MSELRAEILVVGGGLGGVAAALGALRAGRSVLLTEQYAWLGGQLTSQAVPPDEHSWVEQFGVTASYRALRDGIRAYYRRHYPLVAQARAARHLNPGGGHVSRLCHEPRVAVAVIEEMLAPYRSSGLLRVLTGCVPVSAATDGDRVTAVTLRADDGAEITVTASYVLDATETGDLLPLTGAEFVTGAESRAQTGEPSASDTADPANMQAFSVCFAIDHVDGDHTIDRPSGYHRWRSYQPSFWGGPLLGWRTPNPRTLEITTRAFTPNPEDEPWRVEADQRANPGDGNLWTFRRIAARRNFRPGFYPSDICLVNWPMIDYFEEPLIGSADPAAVESAARELSFAALYWLQTEAPRPDGGVGWPGLRLRGDVTGGADGLAMAPYIRESRRIRAEYTIVEQDLSLAVRGDKGAVSHADSIGVGMYRIDLHPSTGGDNYIDVSSCPFEVPLGALIPQRMENLLPAGKNIGTTHITNGSHRLHPVEWNVGEVAGLLADFCLTRGTNPRAVRNIPHLLTDFQDRLGAEGIEVHWPDVSGY
ncbi:FAD-dependent oxidoreductase [Mangrovihabitans endophyticus]|uniref:FAD-dependent oxidoreductase n=1 Tax=Mangrovihabitans endophyticus TaxID=1751298 RepID=A0A8J3BXQ0_9ACTN|nr:FAD-dependent oxidoreductase [Mangrovihabitans endophyticus]GGK81312.1 FAD-dependent oxidoreductase [Mangrovihabitans endophyticus]